MGLMLSGYMGSPMMRRSTSASSAGSMADRSERGGGVPGTGSSSGCAGNTPGSPRIGIVFGGGANVVVGASPRGSNGFVVAGFLGSNNGGDGGGSSGGTGLGVNGGGFQGRQGGGTAPVTQFGQLLNMGGAQDHLPKMSLS
ncbi:UNVERIFIED_CONTAM: hypothetical protein HDU68_012008 [Siphonaria sp. JEL0065]|nr:hypothetical protein HDU68_012008 [Siphonaria sp. JEL0065]